MMDPSGGGCPRFPVRNQLGHLKLFFRALAACILIAVPTLARTPEQSAAEHSGVIIHHIPSPSPWQWMTRRGVYTTSPSIAIRPDGAYVVGLNAFGPGSNAARSGTTYLYESMDRGLTWQTLATLQDMKRGSLFLHNQDVFLIGYTAAPGNIVIRRSTDGGRTWTEPRDNQSGLLREGNYGGTPHNPVVYDGRLWVAIGGKRVLSTPVNADLLRADSWIISRSAQTEEGPLGPGLIITEAQIVAAPHTGVVMLPKVQHPAPRIPLLQVETPRQVRDPEPADWIAFPGGDKKFFVTYDPVSQHFFALSNPVEPPYANRGVPFNLVRNVGALLTSKDLRQWHVQRVVFYTPHVEREAFQYFNAEIDGDDLIVVSRTALQVDRHPPPRGHDSNLITFHRIKDFRTPEPVGLAAGQPSCGKRLMTPVGRINR